MTDYPVKISIGATLAASLGSAVRGAQAQMNQLGSTMADLGNKQNGIKQLEELKRQAFETGAVWRKAQADVMQMQQAKASGQWSTKGLDSARTKVQTLEAKVADPGLTEARRIKAQVMLDRARQSLAEQEAKAEARYTRQIDRLIEKAGKAKTAHEQIAAAITVQTAELQKSGVATAKLASEQARLGAAMETLRTRTDALSQAQQAQAKNMEARSGYRAQMMDAVALGGALYGLVKPAVAFESVMADVKKVVNFDTPDQFGQMSKDILAMSVRIPMAAEGIGAIVAAAGQAGIAREELARFAEDAAKMGVAFDLSGAQAGAAMTGLRSIFGLTQDQVVSLGDAINHLSNNMDAKAGDLLNIANRAGSTAKLFGLSGAQLNALGATFLALKTPPEVAATGINALLMKLATADKQNEKFQHALENIGLSAGVMKKMVKNNAQGALTTFLQQLKTAPDMMGTLTDLFGMEYADDIAKLVGSMDTYQKAVGLVADQTAYAGSMQKEYEARSATTANALQLLQNQTARLGITVGSALLPALNSLVGAVMAPIGSLAALAERFPIVTQGVVGTLAAMVGLKVATIGLGYAWTFVKGPILAAQVAFQSARAGLALMQVQAAATGTSAGLLSLAWSRIQTGAMGIIAPIRAAALSFWSMLPAIGATTVALLANPITWIVAGIGAAVVGLALVIRKYWEPLAAFVGGVFDGIGSAMRPAITGMTTALAPLAPIGNAIASVFGFIANAVGGVVGWIGQLIAPVTLTKGEFASLSVSGHSLGAVIGGVLSTAFNALTFPIRAVGELVGRVVEGFRSLVSFLPLASIVAAWQPVADFFTHLWSGITTTVGQAIDGIVGKIGWVLEAGRKVGEGFNALFGGNAVVQARPAAPGSASAANAWAPVASSTAQTARPLPVAQPIASRGNTTITAPITVNAPPGMDAREIATLIESRLRALMRDTTRSPLAAMYD